MGESVVAPFRLEEKTSYKRKISRIDFRFFSDLYPTGSRSRTDPGPPETRDMEAGRRGTPEGGTWLFRCQSFTGLVPFSSTPARRRHSNPLRNTGVTYKGRSDLDRRLTTALPAGVPTPTPPVPDLVSSSTRPVGTGTGVSEGLCRDRDSSSRNTGRSLRPWAKGSDPSERTRAPGPLSVRTRPLSLSRRLNFSLRPGTLVDTPPPPPTPGTGREPPDPLQSPETQDPSPDLLPTSLVVTELSFRGGRTPTRRHSGVRYADPSTSTPTGSLSPVT